MRVKCLPVNFVKGLKALLFCFGVLQLAVLADQDPGPNEVHYSCSINKHSIGFSTAHAFYQFWKIDDSNISQCQHELHNPCKHQLCAILNSQKFLHTL
ncbi:hypothetical protein BDQ17DRAFT_1351659, partial [Cyathus striatus]